MEVDQVFFCVQMRKFWPTLYFLTVEHAQLMSVIRISQSKEKPAIITTKNKYKINNNKEHTSDGMDMIVKSVFGNCRASRCSFICSYRFCFCFDITLADALIETTFMTLSFASPCLSRGSFSTANARASESCLGAFFGELKALLGEIMWRTQWLSSTDRVSRKPVLPCPVLLAKTKAFTTSLTIVDCSKSLAGCVKNLCAVQRASLLMLFLSTTQHNQSHLHLELSRRHMSNCSVYLCKQNTFHSCMWINTWQPHIMQRYSCAPQRTLVPTHISHWRHTQM